MDELRRPLFVVALVLMGVVVIFEIGAHFALKPERDAGRGAKVLALPGLDRVLGAAGLEKDDVSADDVQEEADAHPEPPGLAIPYQALVDGLLLFTTALMGLSLLFPERVTGRLQGIATLVVSIVVILAGIILAIFALLKLLLMVGLFLAPPFGTIAYFALFGFFNKGGALAVLATLMALKLAFCVVLFLAQQRFLQNKGLVLLIVTSLVTNIVIVFLHGIVPVVLVSITDAIAAIVVAVIAIIWAVVMLIFSIVSVIKVLRVDRANLRSGYGAHLRPLDPAGADRRRRPRRRVRSGGGLRQG